MDGICYGVSVGPGAMGLITLEAIQILEKADIIFLPSFPKEECRAYLAVRESFPEIDDKDLRCETFTMSRDASVMEKRHDEICQSVTEELDAGRNVAFLTLGEVGLYSTYLYIHERLIKKDYHSVLISGISSIQQISDRLGLPLALGNEELHVFPDTEDLEMRLEMAGTKVFMKPKGNLAETISRIRLYADIHPGMRACGMSNCGMDNEVTALNISELEKLQGYFTVIFVYSDK